VDRGRVCARTPLADADGEIGVFAPMAVAVGPPRARPGCVRDSSRNDLAANAAR
jgi:hypothetical protein